MTDYRPTAQAKGTATAKAALIASGYCHDRLPVRLAEMAAGWALEAWATGKDHVAGSTPSAGAPRPLIVADDALTAIRNERET
jgi:hypothetical protein